MKAGKRVGHKTIEKGLNTMGSLTDKVAIVTGASHGIGRAIAERLAHDGATIVVNYSKSAESAGQVVNGIAQPPTSAGDIP
jgi:NAD(P)-dependent dehydrogenase (short-subunit alcohol dehydrogenase family)